MGRPEKDLEEMRRSPQGWRFEEVERVLAASGFTLKNQRGSDRVYKHDPTGVRIFLSWHGSGEVKRGYVRRVVQAIDEARRES